MGKVVVVIEDFQRIRELLWIFLSKKGFVVFSAGTVVDGLRLVEEKKPETLVVDMRLPDGEGLDVVRALRKENYPGQIFVLTGLYSSEAEKAALDAGADVFLSKADGLESVVDRIAG